MAAVHCAIPEFATLVQAAIGALVRAMARSPSAPSPALSAVPRSADLEEVRRACGGDADSYRRLVERHQDHVGRILWRFSRDRGIHEELVQDVFVEAYLSLHHYDGRAPFAHWLARLATRVGFRYWKEKARGGRPAAFDLQEWDEVTADGQAAHPLEPDDAAELLHRLLEQMSPRDRLVLTLRYLDQCDVVETARRTGWTTTMVKVQTLRARNRLRKLIENRGTELIR